MLVHGCWCGGSEGSRLHGKHLYNMTICISDGWMIPLENTVFLHSIGCRRSISLSAHVHMLRYLPS